VLCLGGEADYPWFDEDPYVNAYAWGRKAVVYDKRNNPYEDGNY